MPAIAEPPVMLLIFEVVPWTLLTETLPLYCFIAVAYLLKNATISALLPLTGALISAAGLLLCWPP